MAKDQLPWNANQEIDLLKLISAHGVHLAKHSSKEKTDLWKKVYTDFWNQDSMSEYKLQRLKQLQLIK